MDNQKRKSKKNEYYNCQKKKDTGTHNGGQNTAKNICNESYIIFSIASQYWLIDCYLNSDVAIQSVSCHWLLQHIKTTNQHKQLYNSL